MPIRPLVSYKCYLLTAIFLVLQSGGLLAQGGAWTFNFSGRVQHPDEKKNKDVDLEGAICTLTKGSSVINTVTTGSNGKFTFRLDANGDYIVAFTKPGYITKRFAISTKGVTDERAEHGFGPWDIQVVIFEEYPGVDYSVTNNPLVKVVFNPSKDVDDFDYDHAYTEQMKGALAKLEELAKQARERDKTYAAALAAGDKAFQSKDYAGAKKQYTAAQGVKPAEQTPKDKIKECDAMLLKAGADDKLNADYKAAVAAGDAAMASKSYDAAKTAYTQAGTIKPAEALPPQKLKEINDLLAKASADKVLNDKYTAAVKKGDDGLAGKSYDAAKAGYTEATGLKPSEAYPKQKLKELEDLLNKDKAAKDLDAKYAAAVKKGDDALAAKTYDAAKAGYSDAAGIKPAEAYPKQKLKELEDLMSKDKAAKEADAKYAAAIKKADDALAAKSYDAAKTGYTEATGLKPGEAYPRQKLKDIEDLLNKDKASKETDAKYAAAVKKGDDAFAAKTYDAAKTAYSEASGIKSSEQYPKDKLKAIADLLAADAKNKDAKARYDAAVAKADKALAAKDYATAKASYNDAVASKSDEQYPKDKLKEIDQALAKSAEAKDKNEKYQAAIAAGDAAFKAKKYDEARTGYTGAQSVKPDEAYPGAQLKVIDGLLSKDAADKALNEKYQAAIRKGDDAFGAKTYDAAVAAYTEASSLKASEQYPKDKLKAIAELIAKEKDQKAKYDAAVGKADKALASKDYPTAKTAYNEALGYRSGEQYPKDKLREIDDILSKDSAGKALNAKYQAALAKADVAFKAKKFDDAKAGYTEALAVKPDEEYPKGQLKTIADLAGKDAATKSLNEKYQAALKKGDDAFKAKDYTAAGAGYKDALEVKPEEAYPKAQLKMLGELLAKESEGKALNEKYLAELKKADDAFTAKNYAAAGTAYTSASAMKPAETYPKERLKAIADLLGKDAKNKELSKELKIKYDAAVAKADKAMEAKDYPVARAAYNEALTYRNEEQYPKDKLKEVEELLSREAAAKAAKEADKGAEKLKELNARYSAAISKADAAYKIHALDQAKAAYNEALVLKAGEEYPQGRLKEIEDALAKEQNLKDAAGRYTTAIGKADDAFRKKDYAAAKSGYEEAQAIKPAEAYPKTRLELIKSLLAKDEKDKALNEKYNQAVSEGDKAFAKEDFAAARTAFTQANTLRPNEMYPKDKLAQLASAQAAKSKREEKDTRYKESISKGDGSYGTKEYAIARTFYNAALGFKPGDAYATAKLADINSKLQKLDVNSQREKKYADDLAKGDRAFAANDFTSAKDAYQEAANLRPAETYPKKKMRECDEQMSKSTTTVVASVAPTDVSRHNPLVDKYGQGVTELGETLDGTCKVVTKIVVKGADAWVYKQKTYSWGQVYWFKDDVSISRTLFEAETTASR